MAGFSDFLENKLLAHAFSNSAYTSPSAVYLGLFTAAPSDSGGGTELSGSGYTRKACSFTTSGAASTNAQAVEFPTATGNWGTIKAVGIFDAASSGNFLGWSNLASDRTIETGDVFRFPAGDVDITLD